MNRRDWGWVIACIVFGAVLLKLDVDWDLVDPFATPLWITGIYAGVVIGCFFAYSKLTVTWERCVFLVLGIFLAVAELSAVLKSLGYWVPKEGLGTGASGLLDIPGVNFPEARWVFLAVYVGGLLAGVHAIRVAKGWSKVGALLLTVVFGFALGPAALEVARRQLPPQFGGSQQVIAPQYTSAECPGGMNEVPIGQGWYDLNPGRKTGHACRVLYYVKSGCAILRGSGGDTPLICDGAPWFDMVLWEARAPSGTARLYVGLCTFAAVDKKVGWDCRPLPSS